MVCVIFSVICSWLGVIVLDKSNSVYYRVCGFFVFVALCLLIR